ncbi:hypothetical protein BD408DRAFT_82464 [Parasitella parasitica]|nr:hypothetical protein BD408DRAFT_82464 [Parasitella parasitica]
MSSNHRYEQVPVENHDEENHYIEEQNTTARSSAMMQQRSDLEDTFDISEQDEDTNLLETDGPIQQQSNDGVFSNMAAKPESDSKMEEVPPTYEEASADATPPYWQTTIIAPAGMGDMILVEGLPVGSIFSFLWNLMVSASFQLVGFMLTYLLHTTHAAKDGARAGLGVSLIQYGFYVRSRGTLDEDFDYDGEGHDTVGQDAAQADVIAYLMMFVGWFIILRAVSDFTRARKMEKIIVSEPSVEAIV